MGSIRFVGSDGLYDHEGFVESQSTMVNPLSPEKGHWVSHWSNELDGSFIGWHRAACECGWRGPEVEGPREQAMFCDGFHEQVMNYWAEHVDGLVHDALVAAGVVTVAP